MFRFSSSSAIKIFVPTQTLLWRNKNLVHEHNNRSSLPHNMKIPEITITPSSASLHPNDPDYPEFFEGKMYRESLCSLASFDHTNILDDLSGDLDRNVTQITHKSFTTQLTEEQPTHKEEKALDDSVQILNVGTKKKDKISDCLEILSDDVMEHSDCDEFQDTPELDEVLAKAKNESERQNCVNFAKKDLKRQLSRIRESLDEFECTPAWDVVLAESKNDVEIENCTKFARKDSKRKLSEPSS